METNSSKTGAGIVKRGTLNFINPARIARRAGWNPREDFGAIEELAKSIKANGVLNAIHVKRLSPSTADADFELIDGDRRLTAIEVIIKKATKAGEDNPFAGGVPAILVDRTQTDVQNLIRTIEANTGKPLEALEEADVFKRLRDGGMTVAEISKVVSRSTVHIYDVLALVEADDSVKDAVAKGDISKSQAKKIAHHTKGDKAKQAEIVAAAKAVGNGKTKATKAAKAKAIDKAVTTARKAKAAAKGKTLKMRALTDADLSELGTKVSAFMLTRMKDAGKPADFDVRKWIGEDDNFALAFTFGALEALKAASGMKIDLSI